MRTEQPQAASREDFNSQTEEITARKRAIAEATASGDYDRVAVLAAEAKGLEAKKSEMLEDVQEAATAENIERDAAAKEAAEAKRVAEAAVARAEQAKADAEQRAADAAKAEELLKKIKDGDLKGAQVQEEPSEDIIEKIGAPKTETFEEHGSTMRQSAEELVSIKQQMNDKWKELVAQGGTTKRPDLFAEREALNAQRKRLLDDVEGKSGERMKTAMMDPQIIVQLAKAGELGTGYRPGEGIGQINDRLRGNPEFMMKVLDSLSRDGAQSFSAHTYGVTPQHREVYIAAVKKNHLNYQFGAKEWKTDPEIQKVALESGLDPIYLEK